MFSDSYPHTLIYDEAIIEARARYTKKGSDFVAIASDDVEEDDGEGETVVDIVDAFSLSEIGGYTKKDFMTWAKGYLKATVEQLTKQGKEDRIPVFKKSATEAVKFIAGKWDEMQVFSGQSCQYDGALAFAYQKNQEDEGPTFLYFADGMEVMKLWTLLVKADKPRKTKQQSKQNSLFFTLFQALQNTPSLSL